ncbi:GMC oxidoreductase [Kribbella sp. NBC_01245]|uniref:GMC oxidoreductase n=1 Tax=Kribbella sp. NBC_01245 TaxID=2903578 RepID=UPI002E2BC697|nr:GMC oxidoreductase [Kribbella sp. NBC_01245]
MSHIIRSGEGCEQFDAVVVGTGFGGSVAAARLAQAGQRVVVLERGRRWVPGSFPRNDSNLKDGWLWANGRGLYDVRWLDRMISVQGAGWGGGSLVYANVFARPPAEVFIDHWPKSYRRETLDPYYDLAAHMLEVSQVPADPITGRFPLRTAAMELAVENMGRPAGTVRPQLAVRFKQGDTAANTAGNTAGDTAGNAGGNAGGNLGGSDGADVSSGQGRGEGGGQGGGEGSGEGSGRGGGGGGGGDDGGEGGGAGGGVDRVVVNRHGGVQRSCTFVGECVLGCNRGAKNSLDFNYLTIAERLGAEARVECEVTRIGTAPDGGYEVEYIDHLAARTQVIRAPRVFLGAGAVGTTELLLKAKKSDDLPALSETLGHGFSGNGDFLAFVRGTKVPLDPDHGPTITTTSIVDCEIGGRRLWFQVQDGSYPRKLAMLVSGLNPVHAPFALLRSGLTKLRPSQGRPRRGDNIMTLLLMGRDSSDGRLFLDQNDEAAVEWDNLANKDLYRAESRASREVARQLSGRNNLTPTWRFMRKAVTVHNLGGVPMGPDARTSVIDEYGQVHGYPGLYVVDGAAVPGATGTNPSATITAMAERMLEHAVRDILGDETWRAPEAADVVPAEVPEDVAMAAMAESREEHAGNGVRFRERMTGTARFADGPAAVDLKLSVRLPGWRSFLADRHRRMTVKGTIDVAGIASEAAVDGTLALFPVATEGEAMAYDLAFTADDGTAWVLRGTKTQRVGKPLAVWRDLTTLDFTVAGHECAGDGVLHISTAGAAQLGLSLQGEGYTRRRRLLMRARFLTYFARGAVAGIRGDKAAGEAAG